jgi:hypothetical protein
VGKLIAYSLKLKMSDITLSTQQILTQALKQLSAGAAAPASKASLEITVQHLAANQTLLTNQKNSRTLTVPHSHALGKLTQNTTYESRFSDKQGKPTIEFFAQNGKSSVASQIGSLNRQQLTQLLALTQPKGLQDAGHLSKPIEATVKAITSSGITVSLKNVGQQIDIPLSGKMAVATQFMKIGDTVVITIDNSGVKGSATLLMPDNKIELTDKTQITNPVILSNTDKAVTNKGNSLEPQIQQHTALQLVAETLARAESSNPLTKTQVKLSNNAVAAVLGELITSSAKGTISPVQLDSDAFLKMTKQNNTSFPANFVHNIMAAKTSELSLVTASSGQINVIAKTEKPIASIQLNAELIAPAKALLTDTAQITTTVQTSLKFDKVTTNTDASKHLSEIQTLLRKLQPIADSPSKSIHAIDQSNLSIKEVEQSTVKQLIEAAVAQIKQSIPAGKLEDAQHIKQLLSAPAQLLSTSQLVNANNPNGMVGGLVTLLQLTLAARLNREQPQLTQRIASLLGAVTATAASTSNKPSRIVQDLNQVQQKHQLLKEIARLLAGHQTNKLASAEQKIQGQENFYYILPINIGNQFKDIELLIKRKKENEKQTDSTQEQAKAWHLTMKMDISDIGQLLSKAKVLDNGLELSFYSSNDQVKERVIQFIPQLTTRLKQLGIEVIRSDCQLGKIPDSLQKRPYHLFETQA